MAPSGIRSDGSSGPQNPTSGTTTKGTAVTVPLGKQDLYQVPGGNPYQGKGPVAVPARAPAGQPSGGKTVTSRSSSGQARSLKQVASDEGTSVTQLLSQPGNSALKQKYDQQLQVQIVLDDPESGQLKDQYDSLMQQMVNDPTNSALRQKYEALVQQMMDKYRSYDHQQRRAINMPVVSDQVASAANWVPSDLTIYVPSRKAPDSADRLIDDKQVDNKSADRAEIQTQSPQVTNAKYTSAVAKATEMSEQTGGADEAGPDLRELYSQGQDHLPLDAKLVSYILKRGGLPPNAANDWSVASFRASMTNTIDLKNVDPSSAKADLVQPGMIVTSRDKSRVEFVVSNVEKKDGQAGVYVVAPDRSHSPDAQAINREFRPLSQLDTAGYAGVATSNLRINPPTEKKTPPKAKSDVARSV